MTEHWLSRSFTFCLAIHLVPAASLLVIIPIILSRSLSVSVFEATKELSIWPPTYFLVAGFALWIHHVNFRNRARRTQKSSVLLWSESLAFMVIAITYYLYAKISEHTVLPINTGSNWIIFMIVLTLPIYMMILSLIGLAKNHTKARNVS